MLTEVKKYRCEYDMTPSDDDIKLAISIAKENHCIVEISWVLKWSGHYNIFVYETDGFQTIKDKLPKIYGM